MSTHNMTVTTGDPNGKWPYRVGGMAAIIFAIAYLAIIALYLPMGGKPTGAEAWLADTAAHPTAWWAILRLSVLTDFLLVPVAIALYLALNEDHRRRPAEGIRRPEWTNSALTLRNKCSKI